MPNELKVQITQKYIADTSITDEDLQQELYEAALRWKPGAEWMGCPSVQLLKHLLMVDSEYRMKKAGIEKREESCGLNPQIKLTFNLYL